MGLVAGLALAPLLFDRLTFEVATRAAAAARSAAAPWPAGGEPWFWPGWVATTARVVALAVLVVAAFGVRLPDLAILGTAGVLAATTARAAWATLDVLNAPPVGARPAVHRLPDRVRQRGRGRLPVAVRRE